MAGDAEIQLLGMSRRFELTDGNDVNFSAGGAFECRCELTGEGNPGPGAALRSPARDSALIDPETEGLLTFDREDPLEEVSEELLPERL